LLPGKYNLKKERKKSTSFASPLCLLQDPNACWERNIKPETPLIILTRKNTLFKVKGEPVKAPVLLKSLLGLVSVTFSQS